MLKRVSAGLTAALLFFGVSAQAATIVSAQIVDLYSATFDGALNPDCSGAADLDMCNFFGGDHNLNPRNIVLTSFGTGSGTIQYDGTTLTQLDIDLPDMELVINPGQASETTVTTDSANSPAGIFANADLTPHTDSTASPNFQVEGAPSIIVDFVTFTDIVDPNDPAECTGALCGLIGILSLDGVRYQLNGSVTPGGGDNLTLFVQTGNNSIYEIALQTAAIPVPAAVWLFGSALGLLGWMRRRAA